MKTFFGICLMAVTISCGSPDVVEKSTHGKTIDQDDNSVSYDYPTSSAGFGCYPEVIDVCFDHKCLTFEIMLCDDGWRPPKDPGDPPPHDTLLPEENPTFSL